MYSTYWNYDIVDNVIIDVIIGDDISIVDNVIIDVIIGDDISIVDNIVVHLFFVCNQFAQNNQFLL